MIPSSPRLIFTLAALWCAGLGAAGQFAKLSVPFGALATAYPDAGIMLGPMVSIISGLGVLCGFFAGLIVAHLGFRKLLLLGLWLGAAMSLLQALLPPIPVMLSLRLIEGASHLIIVVAAPTLMAQLAPDRLRAIVMTIWSTFFGVAFALVAWLGLPFAEEAGLGALLGIHGVWMAAVAILLGRVLRKLPSSAMDTQPFTFKFLISEHLRAYRSPHTAAPALGWFCYTLTFVALLTVLPTQLSETERDWASFMMPLAALAVSLTLGIAILRVLSGVGVTMIGFALGIAASLALLSNPGNAVLAVGMMACLGLVQSGSFAAIPQLTHTAAEQARANGAMAQMGNFGNLLGTPLMLFALAQFGTAGIYCGIAVAYAAGLGLHFVQALRRRQVGESASSARP